jgi:CheY-like chemotaxis protein
MALIRKEHPDLVFLDLHLPDTHGEDVLREIWSDGKTRDIPVVILSADASSSRTEQLLVSGATSYLTKPYDIGEVLQIVDRALVAGARS